MWVMFGKQRGSWNQRRSAKRGGRRKNVRIRAIEPKPLGRSFKRKKRLVSRIWLDKVLAGEGVVQI